MKGRLASGLLAVLLVAGCGSGVDTGGDPGAEESLETGDPETEQTTDTESPDENGDGDAVAVELPGLPIGGTASVVSDTLQCVDVGWTAPPDLPGWLGIAVTGVGFTPADGFRVASEPCPDGAPSCLDESFLLTAGGPRCVVPVTWTGPTLEEERLMFFTAGKLSCPAERLPDCEAFRDAVATEGPQGIPLDPAPSEFETDDPATDGPTSDDPETDDPESDAATDEGG